MTQIGMIAVVTPIFIGGAVLATVFIANYFDDKKGEAERKARPALRDHKAVVPPSAAE
jgi:hypothetical protein